MSNIKWHDVNKKKPEPYALVFCELADGSIKKGWYTSGNSWDGYSITDTDTVVSWGALHGTDHIYSSRAKRYEEQKKILS